MITSSLMLNLSWQKVGFFAVAIALMSATLSGLAVGLGALFPNFKEDNPSKVVSSFGGTLCLVISFVYIGLFVALTSLPDLRLVTKAPIPISDATALTTALVISAVVLLVPMRLAGRKVEHLEI
jgi:ABC-2 type transport system permease protein